MLFVVFLHKLRNYYIFPICIGIHRCLTFFFISSFATSVQSFVK